MSEKRTRTGVAKRLSRVSVPISWHGLEISARKPTLKSASLRKKANGGTVLGRCDQATKSVRWMSWRQEAMKDAGTCDKPRGAGNQALILGFLNGETLPIRRESASE